MAGKGTRKRIEEYFRQHIKGQVHKTLILKVVQDEGEKVEVEIKPLSVDIKNSSFRTFRSDNAEEIFRPAFSMPSGTASAPADAAAPSPAAPLGPPSASSSFLGDAGPG